jgi:hypothetical protein
MVIRFNDDQIESVPLNFHLPIGGAHDGALPHSATVLSCGTP